MAYFLWRRRDTPFPGLQWLFVGFIIACGLTHLMEAIIFWWPAYRISALIKIGTATISWITVGTLLCMMPRVLALRSPEQVESELSKRTAELMLHRTQLRDLNATLERRVAERTLQLRSSEERFERAVDGTSDGLWDWDVASGAMWYAARFEELLHYSGVELKRSFQEFLGLIHSEDRDMVLARARCHFEHRDPFDVECRFLIRDGGFLWCRLRGRAVRDEAGKPYRMAGSIQDISDRKQIEHVQLLQITALNAAANMIFIADMEGRITWVNSAFTQITGYALADVKGNTASLLEAEQSKGFYDTLREHVSQGRVWNGEVINRRKDGGTYIADLTVTPVLDPGRAFSHFVVIKKDVTREHALETNLRRSQKLEAIGRLAAGIAHEINTPMQFAGDNVRFLQRTFERLSPIAVAYQALIDELRSHSDLLGRIDELEQLRNAAKATTLYQEIPGALAQSLEGIERVSNIVRALKDFSHPGQEAKTPANINRIIESTVTVARNEWKYVAEMELELAPSLSSVPCIISDLSQTVLNILVNAAHAIEDACQADSERRGHILIATWEEADSVCIRIKDNGTGIPEEHRDKLFDPFFTTKDVGKGTGQGLALAYSAIVDRHSGILEFETELGRGTSFVIRLPKSDCDAIHEKTGARCGQLEATTV